MAIRHIHVHAIVVVATCIVIHKHERISRQSHSTVHNLTYHANSCVMMQRGFWCTTVLTGCLIQRVTVLDWFSSSCQLSCATEKAQRKF